MAVARSRASVSAVPLDPAKETTARRVLVVEDDPDLCELLAELLKEHGYSVDTAANGLEALGVLDASEPPDVIVLDLMMPVMSGTELLEALRGSGRVGVPVIVSSASGGRVEGSPVVAHLPKPMSIRQLLDAVEHAIAPRRAPTPESKGT